MISYSQRSTSAVELWTASPPILGLSGRDNARVPYPSCSHWVNVSPQQHSNKGQCLFLAIQGCFGGFDRWGDMEMVGWVGSLFATSLVSVKPYKRLGAALKHHIQLIIAPMPFQPAKDRGHQGHQDCPGLNYTRWRQAGSWRESCFPRLCQLPLDPSTLVGASSSGCSYFRALPIDSILPPSRF